ncbi:TetR/AcrR family transcriptional regulator [Prauserella cavernicola]|uniref:TetR/AcrR family transcriptional regulator n=1 Tax=Prauserella cavernicola TaxID=2800127 RepID=A0A934QLL7_9PSEU|nr:TetR/AcrR family transcriptional regulator [Prauserella cavernicola]MBK1783112.1 TetR/AcrR family transcriptional regulator [Prauserella cavernicola]
MPATRERLLDVAEELFAEHDYDAVSVRSVNTAAGMNPAAVHYHFGSKEALVAALLEHRLAPLWQDGLAELSQRGRDGSPPAVAELVDVVLAPLAELARDPLGRLRLRLLARVVLGRWDVGWTSRWFGLNPWVSLLRAVRPDLSASVAGRRWLLAFDLVLHTFADPAAAPPRQGRAAYRALRSFVIAGLDAP